MRLRRDRRFMPSPSRYTSDVITPRIVPALVVAWGALSFTSLTWADREKVKLVPADQSLARSGVLRLADLGGASGWTGGATKPSPPTSFTCGTYHARQSDLVLTGSAAAMWQHTAGLQFNSEVQVLRSARMVELDWQRTVTHAGITGCLRQRFGSGLPKGEKVVSFGAVPFPKIAPLTAAYRALIDVRGMHGTVRVMVDIVVFGAGRVELTLVTTAPYVARTTVAPAEVRLAETMAARVQPGAA
jgi:hypothetical protein